VEVLTGGMYKITTNSKNGDVSTVRFRLTRAQVLSPGVRTFKTENANTLLSY
jgi:hypothetical protein